MPKGVFDPELIPGAWVDPDLNEPSRFDWDLADEAAAGAISGTASITFGQSGSLAGSGALAGTAPVVFDESGNLTGSGALSGGAPATFGQQGTGTLVAEASGAAAATFGQSGSLQGDGALAGTAPTQFGQQGSLLGDGALAGTAPTQFGQQGSLLGDGALAGTAPAVFGQSGSLAGSGALAATTQVTFGQSGALEGAGALSGTAAVVFDQSGDLQGIAAGDISGTASIAFGQSGDLQGIAPPTPAARDTSGGSAGWAYNQAVAKPILDLWDLLEEERRRANQYEYEPWYLPPSRRATLPALPRRLATFVEPPVAAATALPTLPTTATRTRDLLAVALSECPGPSATSVAQAPEPPVILAVLREPRVVSTITPSAAQGASTGRLPSLVSHLTPDPGAAPAPSSLFVDVEPAVALAIPRSPTTASLSDPPAAVLLLEPPPGYGEAEDERETRDRRETRHVKRAA
jgi:hypothetical protein